MPYTNYSDPNLVYGALPGDSVPVVLKTWPNHVLTGFSQNLKSAGNIVDTPYSFPNSNAYDNSKQTFANNSVTNFNSTNNVYSPPATVFNTEIINEGGGGGGDVTDVTVQTNDTTGSGDGTVTPLLDVNNSTGPNPEVIIFKKRIENLISSINTNTTKSWDTVQTDGATTTTGAANKTFSLKTKAGDSTNFIATNGSGSNDTAKVEIEWKKHLYTEFTGDTGTSTPQGLFDSCKFEGGDGVVTVADNDKVKFDLQSSSAPAEFFGFKTLGFTDSDTSVSIVADSTGDTGTIIIDGPGSSHNQNATVKKVIEFEATDNNLTARIIPTPEAGFGASLVEVTNNDAPGDYLQNSYGGQSIDDITDLPVYVYAIKIHRFSGGNVTSKDSTATGLLYDFSANQFETNGDLKDAYKTTLSNTSATYIYAPFAVGEVLIAQKIGVNGSGTGVWAIAPTPPKLKVVCP
tara:strand:- start:279 stop:1658 length:1380 start_codon:yes stop_codon:yes gene_type:complete